MTSSPSEKEMPSLLVVGCSGFVGYHLIRHFVNDATFSSVSGISRSSKNRVDGAKYYTADLSDNVRVKELLEEIKPTVIIHAAAPSAVTGTPKDYQSVIIEGTKSLLKAATESPDVQVLVYTSTQLLGRGREHINYNEESPKANTDPKAPAYSRAKANAEDMVIAANAPHYKAEGNDFSGHLTTGALRFPIIYGTHDTSFIPGCLDVLARKETNVQVGSGKNMWSYCSVENAVTAHALFISRILSGDSPHVDGEIFNFNDGEPLSFIETARKIWKLAGDIEHKKIQKIPASFALGLATFMEWIFWVFTFGKKRPERLGKQQVEYACFTHTYSIEKAKKVLGYSPKQNMDEVLKEAIKWFLEEDGWAAKLKSSNKI
jgi:sterol-4alpha-carboxylate 3-dehydrogenase (decarboxylating)